MFAEAGEAALTVGVVDLFDDSVIAVVLVDEGLERFAFGTGFAFAGLTLPPFFLLYGVLLDALLFELGLLALTAFLLVVCDVLSREVWPVDLILLSSSLLEALLAVDEFGRDRKWLKGVIK